MQRGVASLLKERVVVPVRAHPKIGAVLLLDGPDMGVATLAPRWPLSLWERFSRMPDALLAIRGRQKDEGAAPKPPLPLTLLLAPGADLVPVARLAPPRR